MKTNNFIGILITDCSSVPDSTIAAIGEVLRDTMHVNLENVTIKVMNENEIIESLIQRSSGHAEIQQPADANEVLTKGIRNVFNDMTNKIAINASTDDRIKIRIIKGYLRELIIGNKTPTKQEQEVRRDLCYVLKTIRKAPSEQVKYYVEITNKPFMESIFHLSAENIF